MATLETQVLGQSIGISISAPGQQQTSVAGARTETFDSLTPGAITGTYESSIGTYQFSGTGQIFSGDSHGGANGTNYLTFGAQSGDPAPYTLTLKAHANYFGFWWSAGDAKNAIRFFYDDIELMVFSTADLINLLAPDTVGSIGGTPHDSSAYFGNPNSSENPLQPYAYVNIFAYGVTFNRIEFSNSGAIDTGFETDNHSVHFSTTPLGPDDDDVPVTENPTPVPEPGTTALLAAAGGAILYRLIKRRKG